MRVAISHKEVAATDCSGLIAKLAGADVALLLAAKKHGAPILGTIVLEPDMENYNWRFLDDLANGCYHLEWIEKQK